MGGGIVDGGAPVPKVDGFTELVELGRGGFSVVYSANETVFERRVALKVLTVSGNEGRRLEREARALGALSGIPHVLAPYSITRTTDGRPTMVLPLMEASLAALIRSRGRIGLSEVVRWCRQVAGALDGAHSLSIHHRDIKPENILISKDGDAFLADFGIATVNGLESATITVASLSPPHAPPERFSDQEGDPAAGDRYSLASTFYTALAGGPPFGTAAHGGLMGLMTRVSNDPVPSLPPELAALDPVFATGLAKVPGDRFPSASAFADGLAGLTDAPRFGTGSTMQRSTPPSQPPRAQPTGSAARPPLTEPGEAPTVLRGPAPKLDTQWWTPRAGEGTGVPPVAPTFGRGAGAYAAPPPSWDDPFRPSSEGAPSVDSGDDPDRPPWWKIGLAVVALIAGVGAIAGLSALSSDDSAETASSPQPATTTTSPSESSTTPPPTTPPPTPPTTMSPERWAALAQAALIQPGDLGPQWTSEPSPITGPDGLFSYEPGVTLRGGSVVVHSFVSIHHETEESSSIAQKIRDYVPKAGTGWVDGTGQALPDQTALDLLVEPSRLPVVGEFALVENDTASFSFGNDGSEASSLSFGMDTHWVELFRYTWHTHGVVTLTRILVSSDSHWMLSGGEGEVAEIYARSDAAVAARLAAI